MPTVKDLESHLQRLAPLSLAESWDNVGLLVGETQASVGRVMTCLTLTRDCAKEAIEEKADLVVTHHPLPFRPLKTITSKTEYGRVLLSLIQNQIAVYSAHTAFDSAAQGVNQMWAEGLSLSNIKPLSPASQDPSSDEPEAGLGSGRMGELTEPLSGTELVERVCSLLAVPGLQIVGDPSKRIRKIGLACGAAGGFFEQSLKLGCDAFLTGETNFHTCLQVRDAGMLMLLPGHFATERFAMSALAEQLSSDFPEITVWASKVEQDPLQWVVG